MRKYIDILQDYDMQDEIEEGWKGALGAAALAGTALGGYSAATAPQFDSEADLAAAQAEIPKFSDKAERIAKKRGFPSASAMYHWMKQSAANKEAKTPIGHVLDNADDLEIVHPSNMINHVSNTMKDATDRD